MNISFKDGKLVIGGEVVGHDLTAEDFAEIVQVQETAKEPLFYVALNTTTGLLERIVSVSDIDRKLYAALVGNWIAEGYNPIQVDAKTLAKLTRNLNVAVKAAADLAAAASAPVVGGEADGGAQVGGEQSAGEQSAPEKPAAQEEQPLDV